MAVNHVLDAHVAHKEIEHSLIDNSTGQPATAYTCSKDETLEEDIICLVNSGANPAGSYTLMLWYVIASADEEGRDCDLTTPIQTAVLTVPAAGQSQGQTEAPIQAQGQTQDKGAGSDKQVSGRSEPQQESKSRPASAPNPKSASTSCSAGYSAGSGPGNWMFCYNDATGEPPGKKK